MRSFGKLSIVVLAAAAVLALGLVAPAQDKPSADKIIGTWAVEVNAGGENYDLTLELKLAEGKLAGGLSDQSGMFTNAPLTNIEWDGSVLKFGCKIPTPPDGAERLVKTELKYEDGKMSGTITVEDLGMTVSATAVKK